MSPDCVLLMFPLYVYLINCWFSLTSTIDDYCSLDHSDLYQAPLSRLQYEEIRLSVEGKASGTGPCRLRPKIDMWDQVRHVSRLGLMSFIGKQGFHCFVSEAITVWWEFAEI